MEQQYAPATQSAQPQPVVYVAPAARVSVWRIAAATFIGLLVCQLLGILLTACAYGGIIALALAGASRAR